MNEELKARIRARLEAEQETKKKYKLKLLVPRLAVLDQKLTAFSGSEYSDEILTIVKDDLPAALDLAREIAGVIEDQVLMQDLMSSLDVQNEFVKTPSQQNYSILAGLIKRILNYFSFNKKHLS